jgi:hypothetical protein
MKKKYLLSKRTLEPLNHAQRKQMTISNISYVVANIMKKHIGEDNGISGQDLFYKVYGKKREENFVDDFRWDYLKRAMHRLRKFTKLFIVNTKITPNTWIYFVPTNEDEANHYIEALEKNIGRQRAMQRKALKSVMQGWYELDWIQESKMLTTYQELFDRKQVEKK